MVLIICHMSYGSSPYHPIIHLDIYPSIMHQLRGRSYIARYTLGGKGGQPFYCTATAGKGGVKQDKELANLKVTPLIWSLNTQNNE